MESLQIVLSKEDSDGLLCIFHLVSNTDNRVIKVIAPQGKGAVIVELSVTEDLVQDLNYQIIDGERVYTDNWLQ